MPKASGRHVNRNQKRRHPIVGAIYPSRYIVRCQKIVPFYVYLVLARNSTVEYTVRSHTSPHIALAAVGARDTQSNQRSTTQSQRLTKIVNQPK